MQILGLLVMFFDDAVVFVNKTSLLFRLTLAILCRKHFFLTIGQNNFRNKIPLIT